MPTAFPNKETTINGPRTRRWVLTAGECREFQVHRIARMGIDLAQEPYNRVRLRPEGSFILACLEGEGQMFLEGRWQRVASGDLCLAPPRVLNALHAVPGKKWIFAWLRYDEPPFMKPLVGADSPLRLRGNCEQIGNAIRGLRAEWEQKDARDAALCHHYISLVQRLAQRAASPWRTTSRMNDIWEFVASHLAEDWTLPTLAERCHLSPEHLRRLCLREFGRTPMDHMAYMRMLRARELLETTNDKVEVIASSIGYRSGTIFSRAFQRYVGVLPTQYRDQR